MNTKDLNSFIQNIASCTIISICIQPANAESPQTSAIFVEPKYTWRIHTGPDAGIEFDSREELFSRYRDHLKSTNNSEHSQDASNLRPWPTSGSTNGLFYEWQWDWTYTEGSKQYSGTTGSISMSSFCPIGWEIIGEQNLVDNKWVGTKKCKLDLTVNQDPPANICPITNKPVYGENGTKIQIEPDYATPNRILTHVRVWRSDRKRFFGPADNFLPLQNTTHCHQGYYQWNNGQIKQAVQSPHCFRYLGDVEGQTTHSVRANGNLVSYRGNSSLTPAADINTRILVFTIAGETTYRLYTEDNALEIYNASGQLQSRQLAGGPFVSYTYSDATTPVNIAPRPGLLVQMTDFQGRSLRLAYEGTGQLASLTDPASQVIRYMHDEKKQANCSASVMNGQCRRLTSVAYPDGGVRRYHYNEPGAIEAGSDPTWTYLTGITDERGIRLSTYKYDAQGKTIESGWGVEKYQLSYGNLQTTVMDPLGTQRTVTYTEILGRKRPFSQSQPAGAGCLASTRNFEYDGNGNIKSRDDFGGQRTCVVSDPGRNLEIASVEGLSNGAACPADLVVNSALPAGSRKTSTQWHPDWRLVSKLAEPGRVTTSVYNGQPDPFNGNATASCAPVTAKLPDGKPIAVLCKQVEQATTDSDGHFGFGAVLQPGVAPRQTTWTYNQYGQPLTEDGPRTDVADITRYAYYTDTTADHTLGDLKQVTDASGKVTEFTKYNKHGQVLESRDPNGVLTVNTYDLRQRLLSTTVGSSQTKYTYDAVGQLKKVTQPDSSFVAYDYDDAHRLSAVYDNTGNRIEYTLDNAGNRKVEKIKDPGNLLKKQLQRGIDPLGRVDQTKFGQ